jgi:hypothetical protein
MSNTIPVSYTDPCVLHNPKRGYWQCGVWVTDIKDATIYPDSEEAAAVRALRSLGLNTNITPVKK